VKGYIGIRQDFGRYSGSLDPGCNFYCCFYADVSSINMRVRMMEHETATKTLDNVTIDVKTAILYKVIPEKVQDAFYKLQNIESQMASYVEDVVRSQLPLKELDHAYACKGTMASAIHKSLSKNMEQFGIMIDKILVTDLRPDRNVVDAMNAINMQKRNRAAAEQKAEAEKILVVKNAEAEMEAKRLSGVGMAKMRTAITNGFKESIDGMKKDTNMTSHDVIEMMLVCQYLDTLKDFSVKGRGSVMIPNNGGGVENDVRMGFVTAGMVKTEPTPHPPPPR